MIAVVIPVRNRAELVKRTLASIDAQRQQPAQVVLVDNCSTDGTLDVLRQWAKGKPWVTVVTESRPGAAEARNRGLREVSQPYVMFFDSDDVMPPHHIADIMHGMKRAGMPDIGAFDMMLVGLDGKPRLKRFRRGNAMRQQLFHCILSTLRYIVSTPLLRRIGGWEENLPAWDDYVLGVKLLINTESVAYLPLSQPVMAYSQSESITGTSFSGNAGQWEQALDTIGRMLPDARWQRIVNARRAILAGHYLKEGRPDLAKPLMRSLRSRVIARYVSLGGRGVHFFC